MKRPIPFVSIVAGLALSWCEHSPADLVELRNGEFRAGKVRSTEADGTIVLETGTSAGRLESKFTKDDVIQVHRAHAEDGLIRSCTSAERLRSWAAGYYFGGLESTGRRCVRQAWASDPSVGDRPLAQGLKRFRLFWNRELLKQKSASARELPASEVIGLARWALDGGLGDESASLLRTAWNAADRKSEQVIELAAKWGVNIESWIELDLKPAIENRLFRQEIHDEETPVKALIGHEFLTIPFWFDREIKPRVVSESIAKSAGKDVFYGMYVLDGMPEPGQAVPLESMTVFESMEIVGAADGSTEALLRNKYAPRVQDGKTVRRDRVSGRAAPVRASGWGVLVLEVPRELKELTLEWGDGGSEGLDLEFLRSASTLSKAGPVDSDDQAVVRCLERLDQPSGAIAELAVHALRGVRDQLPQDRAEDWCARIDPRVAAAAGRLEDQVRAAVWSYFSGRVGLTPSARKTISSAGAEVQLAWIGLVSARLGRLDGRASETAVELIWTLLTSEDKTVCRAAFDVLTRLEAVPDWKRLEGVSETAQGVVLDSLAELSRDDAVQALMALMKSVREPGATRVAEAAKTIDLRLSDPRDPILSQWNDMQTDADRAALLKVLGEIELEDLAYSRTFGNLLESAGRSARRNVREAAHIAAVNQYSRWLDRRPVFEAKHVRQTSWPLLLGQGSDDSLLRGVIDAGRKGRKVLRLDAVALLLRAGFAREAEAALLWDEPSNDRLCERLEALVARQDIASCNGLLALLGRLLTPERSACARPILRHLNQAYAADPIETNWRVLAAVKAGANFEALCKLVNVLEEPGAGGVLRWLNNLGHLSRQDRKRLAAAQSFKERSHRLEQIDHRQAQLPESRYGVLGVLETCTRVNYAPVGGGVTTAERWSTPQRQTLVLPTLEIRAGGSPQAMSVFWQDKQIGEGVVRSAVRPVRAPDSLPILLSSAGKELQSDLIWGWPDKPTFDSSPEPALGPAVFCGREVIGRPRPETINIRLTDYFRSSLESAGVLSHEQAIALVPEDYMLTLRYASFGSFCGVGMSRAPPEAGVGIGTTHLINVVLVLERLD